MQCGLYVQSGSEIGYAATSLASAARGVRQREEGRRRETARRKTLSVLTMDVALRAVLKRTRERKVVRGGHVTASEMEGVMRVVLRCGMGVRGGGG
eukprot:1328746-Rhodomonas_salina.3